MKRADVLKPVEKTVHDTKRTSAVVSRDVRAAEQGDLEGILLDPSRYNIAAWRGLTKLTNREQAEATIPAVPTSPIGDTLCDSLF